MVEKWERFSFYGMVALLVPYLTRREVRRGKSDEVFLAAIQKHVNVFGG